VKGSVAGEGAVVFAEARREVDVRGGEEDSPMEYEKDLVILGSATLA